MGPAHERHKVVECFGEVAAVAMGEDGDIVLALAHFTFIFVANDGEVRKDGSFPAEGLVE